MTMSNLWIDVKHRLPQNDKPVLIFIDHGEGRTSFDIAKYNLSSNRFEYIDEYWGNEIKNVTHWQWLKAPNVDKGDIYKCSK